MLLKGKANKKEQTLRNLNKKNKQKGLSLSFKTSL